MTKDYNSIRWNDLFTEDSSSATGLVWKVDRMRGKTMSVYAAKAGDVAGCIKHYKKQRTNMAIIHINGSKWLVHRVLWVMRYGNIDEESVIDHIDGNTMNNSIDNLRKVPHIINSRNSKKRSDNTSGKTGVYFRVSGGLTYVVASWTTDDLKSRSKRFSVNKLGLLQAYSSACTFRDSKIVELNKLGFGYSLRHGK